MPILYYQHTHTHKYTQAKGKFPIWTDNAISKSKRPLTKLATPVMRSPLESCGLGLSKRLPRHKPLILSLVALLTWQVGPYTWRQLALYQKYPEASEMQLTSSLRTSFHVIRRHYVSLQRKKATDNPNLLLHLWTITITSTPEDTAVTCRCCGIQQFPNEFKTCSIRGKSHLVLEP